MKNYKLTLNIGFNDKDTKTAVRTVDESKKIVQDYILESGFDGFTIIDTFGMYKHDGGAVVFEQGCQLTLIVFDSDDEQIEALAGAAANDIGLALNQESVIYQVDELKSVMNFTQF